jgi:hypothetical protein
VNCMGVRINPMAWFQPATLARRFKMLNALDVVQIYPSVCNVHQTLRAEVITSGLLPELILSQKCHTVYVHMVPICNGCWVWSSWCSGCALGGRTHVTKPVVLQIANRAVISYCDICAVSSYCKNFIFLWRIRWYSFCVWGLQR